MASFYGNNTGNHWQAYCEWNVTGETADTVTISGTTYFHSIAWGFQIRNVNGGITIDGNQNYTTGNSVSTGTGQTANTKLVSHTVTLVKGDKPRNITISTAVRNTSGYMDGYSTGSAQYTVPAKQITSYTVTFDANGGTGAPAPAKKEKGHALTLPMTEPTRDGYTFEGWSLTKDGTVNYRPGSAYTTDADATLYAVWSYDKSKAPVVTSLSAYRVASNGSTNRSPNGSWGYVECVWTSLSPVTQITGQYQNNEGIVNPIALELKGQTTGTGGTAQAWFSAGTDSSYSVMLTLTNENGQTTDAGINLAKVLSSIISLVNQGAGVGILSEAPESGINLGSFGGGAGVSINPANSTIGFNGTSTFNGYVQIPAATAWDVEDLTCTAENQPVNYQGIRNMNEGLFALKDGGIQVKKTGWYRIEGALRIDGYANPMGNFAVGYFVNGLEPEGLVGLIHSSTQNFGITSVELPVQVMQLNANDTVQMMCRTTDGGGRITDGFLTISL